ncbi:CD2 antigen cytoplasmic tail-binding protein 2 homolog isoform X3 [Musca autumnalis]|uniref:CD2 antigen cytoplasmic tail-binding protein 2 homolog isoform X3 n=1 Tax=Musca autumnalis TaxID=221902 RepID=UPI003CF302CE
MSIKRNNNLNVDDVCKITSKKHTLDSDEEDSDEYERDDVDDVDGEEDGVPNIRDDIKITPFNMREELEEGHFDKEGHYHWDKNSDIRDNWLDNIDWMKIPSSSGVKLVTRKGLFEQMQLQNLPSLDEKLEFLENRYCLAEILWKEKITLSINFPTSNTNLNGDG